MKKFILLAMISFALNAKADKYSIDPAHSSVVFKINHLGFSNVYGMFSDVSGTFDVDDKKSGSESIELVIKTASVDTKNAKRNEHLLKPDFFDAKQFPDIVFKSQSVKKVNAKTYKVQGELTMHGVTKPLSFQLTRFRTGMDPMNKQRTGGETSFKIKRGDFGMNFMNGPNMVGNDVDVLVSLEGIKQ